MSNPYVGEIRMVGFNFAPLDWMFCNGQLLPISEYSTLFNLIGTTYGGDGVQTFALPNLQSRVPIHSGTGTGSTYVIGQTAGNENITLNNLQLPQHTHLVNVSNVSGTTGSPNNNIIGVTNGGSVATPATGNLDFIASAPISTLASNAVQVVGGSQPHTNIQPSLVVNFIISLFGVYPSQG
jgi:microcystin-dependent protein